MSNFRYRLQNYLAGRRGIDEYSKFLIYASLVTFLISVFVTNVNLHKFIYLSAMFMLIWAYARMMSKNLVKRQRENLKYIQMKSKILHKAPFSLSKSQYGSQSGAFYRYFHCPNCKQNCRVPKNKGKIRITCPRCGEVFEKRS